MSIFMGITAFGAAGILAGPALIIVAKAMVNKNSL
jgi:predicted PurR-regulated permease PerM